MADTRGRIGSPRRNKNKRRDKVRPILYDKPHAAGRGGKQPHAERRIHRTGCHNREVRKGIGGVVFALGIPFGIAGLVMTVTDATDSETEGKYPSFFSSLGPVLIVIAVILFVIGFALLTTCLLDALDGCFAFDEPDSFCRVRCPRLSQLLSPDDTISINRAAMNALRTEPGKSALKRPLVSLVPSENAAVATEKLTKDSQEHTEHANGRQTPRSLASIEVVSEMNPNQESKPKINAKGVRFSESDTAEDVTRGRAPSAASDSSSALSLRHCKVHPKEENVWWTESNGPRSPPLAPEDMTTEL